MKKDNLIYDHFNRTWVDPYTWKPTELFIEEHNAWRNTCRGILAGVFVSVMIGFIVLIICLGIIKP